MRGTAMNGTVLVVNAVEAQGKGSVNRLAPSLVFDRGAGQRESGVRQFNKRVVGDSAMLSASSSARVE